MTAVWDIVQSFLTKVGELKDPEYYEDALRFVKAIISSIHDIDHAQDERVSRSVGRTRGFKDIEEFMKKVK